MLLAACSSSSSDSSPSTTAVGVADSITAIMKKPRYAGATWSLLVTDDANGDLQVKAQNLAGCINTKSGRTVAYALLVNDAGPAKDIEADVGAVIADEATISSLIYESM
jgi:D-alanyl-D-alanine carboxypeptidase